MHHNDSLFEGSKCMGGRKLYKIGSYLNRQTPTAPCPISVPFSYMRYISRPASLTPSNTHNKTQQKQQTKTKNQTKQQNMREWDASASSVWRPRMRGEI